MRINFLHYQFMLLTTNKYDWTINTCHVFNLQNVHVFRNVVYCLSPEFRLEYPANSERRAHCLHWSCPNDSQMLRVEQTLERKYWDRSRSPPLHIQVHLCTTHPSLTAKAFKRDLKRFKQKYRKVTSFLWWLLCKSRADEKEFPLIKRSPLGQAARIRLEC